MISYMVDGQGYLIISREVVSEDIEVRRMQTGYPATREGGGGGGGGEGAGIDRKEAGASCRRIERRMPSYRSQYNLSYFFGGTGIVA